MPYHAKVRIRLELGLALASLAGVVVACTDGRVASVRGEPEVVSAVPRNSDGSPQILPPGPPSRPPHTLVLAYADFGPQVMASELLGMEWWQWEAGGSWEPGDAFDVRVVVYRGMTLAEVQAEYPTVVGKADHRYVSYDEAMAYFDRSLAELEDDPSLARLHEELAVTRARVRETLGAAEPGAGR